MLEGQEAGKLGGYKAGKLGGYKAWKRESLEAESIVHRAKRIV